MFCKVIYILAQHSRNQNKFNHEATKNFNHKKEFIILVVIHNHLCYSIMRENYLNNEKPQYPFTDIGVFRL